MDQPLVSVLMTSYNREKYVAFAIESVLNSSYINFELIVVDDGSSDLTVEIARSFESRDSRVKVYVNPKNLGDYPNRNKAATYAKGKYIKYVDADDAVYPWALEAEVKMMEQFPEAGYGLDSISQDDLAPYPYSFTPAEAYEAYYVRGVEIFNKAPTSCIIKREVFDRENGFRELRMVGDCEMWHRLSLKYPVVIMPHGMVWSRGHEESQSGLYMRDKCIIYHYLSVQQFHLKSASCPLNEPYRGIAIRQIERKQSRLLIKALLKFNCKTYRKMMRISPFSISQIIRSCF